MWDQMSPRQKVGSVGAVSVALIAAGFWTGQAGKLDQPVKVEPGPAVQSPITAPSKPELLTVHVAGAVRNPGVYQLAPGSRVTDAVRAAGGWASGADPDQLNLAASTFDGMKIDVPFAGQALPPDPGTQRTEPGGNGTSEPLPLKAGEKISINNADQTELERLPGIGTTLAARIVEYRQTHGPFQSLEGLMEVEGIGEGTYRDLEPYISL